MVITIASGKGGTGKTTFAVNLAAILHDEGKPVRLLDCDVEEPNDHLFIQPEFSAETPVTALKPIWYENRCTGCGLCAEACKFNAIAVVKGRVLIFNELCHSCGVCSFVCPEEALIDTPHPIGMVRIAEQKPFFFAHGELNIGEALAPSVVRAVKKHADLQALTLIDAAPGTACPVVEAVRGADAAVLVTEPTPFGLNDLKLAVGLTLKQGVPTGILINRSDGKDAIIADYAEAIGLPIIGRIPFKREYAEVYSGGGLPALEFPEFRQNLLAIYDNLCRLPGSPIPPLSQEEEIAIGSPPPQTFAVGNAAHYREIAVISGKGGTGKTTVTAAFAQLARSKVIADTDVDAADLHLLLAPMVLEKHDFSGGTRALIDVKKCTACGRCAEVCRFDAIRFDGMANSHHSVTYRIDPIACEGCGLCARVCPENAISDIQVINGQWFVSATEYGPLVHARLGIAEENSGKLVTQVRKRAAELARELKLAVILADGPPGTGCPVIASLSGVDLAVIVTEPTVSGVHDLERVLQLSRHFEVPAGVIINKADLNKEQASRIDRLAQEYGAEVIARIPFDRAVNDALMAGKTVIEFGGGAAAEAIRESWERIDKFYLNGEKSR